MCIADMNVVLPVATHENVPSIIEGFVWQQESISILAKTEKRYQSVQVRNVSTRITKQ
jgi:hypothetical protein